MKRQSHSVLFRADGNAQIGLGHVMRCLALAEMLGPDYNRRFALVRPDPALVERIEEKHVAVIQLQTDALSEFALYIGPTDVLVLDGYSFDDSYQRAVRQRAKTLVVIDDLVTGHQVADVLINHAGAITEYDYSSEAYTQFLLGPRYALLRPPFFGPSTPIPQEGPIFVSLGGADPSNTTLRVLEALSVCFRMLNQAWRVHVVIGPMQQNRPQIEALQSHFKHLTLLSNLTAEQLVGELTKSILAITACSTIAYEVCAINRPLIAVQTAGNQARLATFLGKNSLAIEVIPPAATVEQFIGAIRTGLVNDFSGLRALLSKNQRQFFDGKSPERFRALFSRLCA